jgi:hypothetical protein
MSGQAPQATSNMDRRQLSARRRLAAATRRLVLVGALVASVLLGVASVASASSSFYWYGENSLTCWQTGSLGSGSSACDSVGEGYLPGHVHSGAIGEDVELVNSGVSGDYCNYYNIGAEGFDTTNELEQAGLTGFNPPRPFGDYQEGNKYNPPDVCQAYSDTWGEVVRGNSANKTCDTPYAPCGMQHFVSLGGQGTNDRPWSTAFGSPALVISAEDNPHTIEAPNSWGYICPLLKSPSGAIFEYCLEAWHVGSGSFPAYKHADEAGPCNFGAGQTFTEFLSGTKFAELVSGSSETFEYKNNFASRTFTARITKSDLEAAISAVEGHGCGAQSHNISEYALVGIEQGTEGGGLTTLGESTAHLQAWTTYTPLPPEATTNAASEVREEQATLNGSVNPKGTDTHYYFQYGETTAYGSTTGEGDAGSGTSSVSKSNTITGLQPGMAYHYRIVATSAGGTKDGADQTFTTPSAPSMIIDKANNRWVATEGASHTLDIYLQPQETGVWAGPDAIGGTGTTYSAPSMIIDQANDRWVAVEGASHTLDVYEQSQATGKWTGPVQIGGAGTTYSAPSMIIDQANNRWVAVEGANHTLDIYLQPQETGKWAGPDAIGGAGTTYSAPSMIIDTANDRWVSAEGASNSLDIYLQPQETGKWAGPDAIGGAGTTYSAPSMIIDQANNRWVSAEGASNSLDIYLQPQETGKWAGPDAIGGAGTTYSTPSMIIDQANNRWVSVEGASNSLDIYLQPQETGKWAGPDPIGGTGTTW